MIASLDTNILIYAADDRFPSKRDVARGLVDRALASGWPLALQVCGEFFRVATARLGMPLDRARREVEFLLDGFPSFRASRETTRTAVELASTGRLSIWDANLVTAAEAADCDFLFSEDMKDGLRIGRLQIVNPFAGDKLSERAQALLSI